MGMKKVQDRDRKDRPFYYRCNLCGYETEERKTTRENLDEQPPLYCPRCGKEALPAEKQLDSGS